MVLQSQLRAGSTNEIPAGKSADKPFHFENGDGCKDSGRVEGGTAEHFVQVSRLAGHQGKHRFLLIGKIEFAG